MGKSRAHAGSRTPVAAELAQHAKVILRASLAASTWNAYKRAWDKFQVFSTQVMQTKMQLPIPVADLLLYIACLHKEGSSASTVASSLSALSHFQRMLGHQDNTKHFMVMKMIAGARNLSAPVAVRLPITAPVLMTLVRAIPLVFSHYYDRKLLRAMLCLAFYAFLRIGEMIPKSFKVQAGVLQISDLHWQNKKHEAMITLRKFKNSAKQGTQSFRLQENAGSNKFICPVHALRKYVKVRGSTPGPLFVSQNKPILRKYFDTKLQTLLRFCGYDPKFYKGHSFRIGAATDAASRGLSDAQIRNLGRWQSDAFRKYIRLSNLQK